MFLVNVIFTHLGDPCWLFSESFVLGNVLLWLSGVSAGLCCRRDQAASLVLVGGEWHRSWAGQISASISWGGRWLWCPVCSQALEEPAAWGEPAVPFHCTCPGTWRAEEPSLVFRSPQLLKSDPRPFSGSRHITRFPHLQGEGRLCPASFLGYREGIQYCWSLVQPKEFVWGASYVRLSV